MKWTTGQPPASCASGWSWWAPASPAWKPRGSPLPAATTVTVFGASDAIGGKAWLREQLPGGETVSSIYDYQTVAARRAGARIVLGGVASAADILALRPDVVVLATGATMIPPDWLPDPVRAEGWVPDLRSAMPDVLRHAGRQSGTAVLFDTDHTEGTYAAAEALRARFDRVVLVTPRDTIATDVQMVTRQGILRRMAEQRIEIVTLVGAALERCLRRRPARHRQHL